MSASLIEVKVEAEVKKIDAFPPGLHPEPEPVRACSLRPGPVKDASWTLASSSRPARGLSLSKAVEPRAGVGWVRCLVVLSIQ